MIEKKYEKATLVCDRCGKHEAHYVFNKFYYDHTTVDFCDECAHELRVLLDGRDGNEESVIRQFIE